MLVKCPFAIEGQTPLWWRWSTALTLGLTTLAASCLTLRGLSGWSSSASSVPASIAVARSIRVPQLVITQRENDDHAFDLRLRLPDQFSLTFEVLGSPADLSKLEVLGHPLGSVTHPYPSVQDDTLWHRVQIRRRDSLEIVMVDEHPVGGVVRPIKPASWLTIRPSPGQIARIRDLELCW